MATYNIDTSGFTPEQIALVKQAGTLAAPGNTVTTYQSNPTAPVTPISYDTASKNLAGAGLPTSTLSGAQQMLATAYQAPSTISSNNLSSTPTTAYQSPTPTQPYPVSTLQDVQLTPTQQQGQDLSSQLMSLNNQLAGKSAYQTQENTAFGVDAAQKSIQDLGAQLTGLKNEAAAIPLQLQQGAADRGVTTPVLGAQENSRLRTNAIAALGVSTLLAAAQGQLANAQSLADKAVAEKYGPIEEELKIKMTNLQLLMNSPLATLEEKKQAAQMQLALQAQQQQVAEQKTNATEVWNIATTAASNIQSFTPTAQYPTASVALQAISQAPTKEQALQIAATTGFLSSVTSPDAKILGSASTGYYTYDPATGKTTPIANPNPTPPSSPNNPTSPTNSNVQFYVTQLLDGNATYLNSDGSIKWSGVPAAIRSQVYDEYVRQQSVQDSIASSYTPSAMDVVKEIPGTISSGLQTLGSNISAFLNLF